jgi:hypothetical protein
VGTLSRSGSRPVREVTLLSGDADNAPIMARCFMSRISRIIAATIAAVLSALPVYAQKPLQTDVNIPWEEIGRIAREFVARESPPSVWPFMRARPADLAKSPQKVLIHYFPFFVLSYENAPLDTDHWAEFTSRKGINGRFADIGGYTRERPLTPARSSNPNWKYIDAAIDILRAQLIGADGFGVDIPGIASAARLDQVRILCETAAAIAPGFRIALEPGTASLKQNGTTATDLADELADLSRCPAVYRMDDGRLLVIPFAPDLKPVEYWTEVLDRLRKHGESVAFVPDFLNLGANFDEFLPVSVGATHWGARDPTQAAGEPLMKLEQFARSKSPLWMQPVVPQDVRPKASIFWEAANTELFRDLWMRAIDNHAQYAHVLTWNDYGETTEVEPSSGTQFLFYDLSAYFTTWFKLDHPPPVTSDAIYYSHRTEIYVDGEQPQHDDRPFKRMGRTPVSNAVEMVALLTEQATLEIQIADKTQQLAASTGLTVFKVPAQPGRPIFRIRRGGAVVLEKTSDWVIDSHPRKANPAYFGGSSTRKFVQIPQSAMSQEPR